MEKGDTYRTYGDELVGMIHHGDQQVQQHDDVDDGEHAEHEEAPEPDNHGGSQSDVVFLGLPLAPSYIVGERRGGVAGSQQMSTAVHVEPK